MLYDQQVGQEATMKHVNIAEAQEHLSELVAQVENGETVQISRHGKPVAEIVAASAQAAAPRKKPFDFLWLRQHLDSMPMQQESAGDFIRKMRDTDRY